MGRKTPNRDKEWDENKRLKEENRRLKRAISRQRKIIHKFNEGQDLAGLLALVEAQRKEDRELHDKNNKDLRKKWKCYECEDGVMILQIFKRLDGIFYYRRCACGNKTRMKKYHDGVKGIENE